jgi:hypothetical protein
LKLHLEALAFHCSTIFDFDLESTPKHLLLTCVATRSLLLTVVLPRGLLLTVVLPQGLRQGESKGQVAVFSMHVNCYGDMVQNKFAVWHIQYVCAVLTILGNNVFEITENIYVITLVSFIISDNFHHTQHCMPCS